LGLFPQSLEAKFQRALIIYLFLDYQDDGKGAEDEALESNTSGLLIGVSQRTCHVHESSSNDLRF